MKTHKFDVEDAEKHGIKKALLLEHLKFHQENNIHTEKFNIDGKVWCEAKRKTLEKIYPYFDGGSMNRWLRELEDDGIIVSKKAEISDGKHHKYYHVIGHKVSNVQNEQSNVQNEHSARDCKEQPIVQNEHSSIMTYVNRLSGGDTPLPEKIENAGNIDILSGIWFEYLREKAKTNPRFHNQSLSAQKMTKHQIGKWGLCKSRKIIAIAIQNDWNSLKEEYLPKDELQENKQPFRTDMISIN